MSRAAAFGPPPSNRTPGFTLQEGLWFGDFDDEAARQTAASSMVAMAGRVVGARPFPEAAQKLVQLTRNENTDIHQVVRVLEMDPGLSQRVLRLVNSPGYGLRMRCTSLGHAAALLGQLKMRQIATSAALFDHFGKPSGITRRKQEHASLVASLCRYLAIHLGLPQDDLFTVGLLHDLGQLMMLDDNKSNYAELVEAHEHSYDTLHLAERDLFGFDHAVLAGQVMASWSIPSPVPEVVSLHHSPAQAHQHGLEISAMVQTLRFADQMAHLLEKRDRKRGPRELAESEAASYLDFSEMQIASMWRDLEKVLEATRTRRVNIFDVAPRFVNVPASLAPRDQAFSVRAGRPSEMAERRASTAPFSQAPSEGQFDASAFSQVDSRAPSAPAEDGRSNSAFESSTRIPVSQPSPARDSSEPRPSFESSGSMPPSEGEWNTRVSPSMAAMWDASAPAPGAGDWMNSLLPPERDDDPHTHRSPTASSAPQAPERTETITIGSYATADEALAASRGVLDLVPTHDAPSGRLSSSLPPAEEARVSERARYEEPARRSESMRSEESPRHSETARHSEHARYSEHTRHSDSVRHSEPARRSESMRYEESARPSYSTRDAASAPPAERVDSVGPRSSRSSGPAYPSSAPRVASLSEAPPEEVNFFLKGETIAETYEEIPDDPAPQIFACSVCYGPTFGAICPACRAHVCPSHQGKGEWCVSCEDEFHRYREKNPISPLTRLFAGVLLGLSLLSAWFFFDVGTAVGILGLAVVLAFGGYVAHLTWLKVVFKRHRSSEIRSPQTLNLPTHLAREDGDIEEDRPSAIAEPPLADDQGFSTPSPLRSAAPARASMPAAPASLSAEDTSESPRPEVPSFFTNAPFSGRPFATTTLSERPGTWRPPADLALSQPEERHVEARFVTSNPPPDSPRVDEPALPLTSSPPADAASAPLDATSSESSGAPSSSAAPSSSTTPSSSHTPESVGAALAASPPIVTATPELEPVENAFVREPFLPAPSFTPEAPESAPASNELSALQSNGAPAADVPQSEAPERDAADAIEGNAADAPEDSERPASAQSERKIRLDSLPPVAIVYDEPACDGTPVDRIELPDLRPREPEFCSSIPPNAIGITSLR